MGPRNDHNHGGDDRNYHYHGGRDDRNDHWDDSDDRRDSVRVLNRHTSREQSLIRIIHEDHDDHVAEPYDDDHDDCSKEGKVR